MMLQSEFEFSFLLSDSAKHWFERHRNQNIHWGEAHGRSDFSSEPVI